MQLVGQTSVHSPAEHTETMVDFEIDQFKFIGFRTLMRSNFNTFVRANAFALTARNAKVLACFRIYRKCQPTSYMGVRHLVRINLSDRLAERVHSHCLQTTADLIKAVFGACN